MQAVVSVSLPKRTVRSITSKYEPPAANASHAAQKLSSTQAPPGLRRLDRCASSPRSARSDAGCRRRPR